jgi:hypothetical protein
MADCVFCTIVADELPASIFYGDADPRSPA